MYLSSIRQPLIKAQSLSSMVKTGSVYSQVGVTHERLDTSTKLPLHSVRS